MISVYYLCPKGEVKQQQGDGQGVEKEEHAANQLLRTRQPAAVTVEHLHVPPPTLAFLSPPDGRGGIFLTFIPTLDNPSFSKL